MGGGGGGGQTVKCTDIKREALFIFYCLLTVDLQEFTLVVPRFVLTSTSDSREQVVPARSVSVNVMFSAKMAWD